MIAMRGGTQRHLIGSVRYYFRGKAGVEVEVPGDQRYTCK